MQFIAEYGLFLAKAVTVLAAVLIVAGVLTALTSRQKKTAERRLEVTDLNRHYEQMERALRGALLPPREFKRELKAKKKADKAKAKADKRAAKADAKTAAAADADGDAKVDAGAEKPGDGDGEKTVETVDSGQATVDANDGEKVAGQTNAGDGEKSTGESANTVTNEKPTGESNTVTVAEQKPNADETSSASKRIFVLNFDGDIRASAVSSLCQEVSAILTMAGPGDEVVVRVESGGGVVHGYGLAASQLRRLRDRGIPLTVAVDKIAASGGYMMACVADQIIAAPFAFIGSIGVLLQAPNLRGLLKKHDVEFEQIYAGEHKRTLTLFGENTDKAREKVRQQIEETHNLFKAHVKAQRPGVDIEQVATGEYWLGSRALEMGLVDRLQTSDDYLMDARFDAQILELHYAEKLKLIDRFSSLMRARWSGPAGIGAPGDGLDRPMVL
ncbi:MAG: protease SohB [Gammaproteobacteria bacterium]|nr:protease SohB [Gammaproteobacteria bacterium]